MLPQGRYVDVSEMRGLATLFVCGLLCGVCRRVMVLSEIEAGLIWMSVALGAVATMCVSCGCVGM